MESSFACLASAVFTVPAMLVKLFRLSRDRRELEVSLRLVMEE